MWTNAASPAGRSSLLSRALHGGDLVIADKGYAGREFEHAVAQLRQMGHADERAWAAVLRANHVKHDGAPLPRRQVDNPALATR